VRRLAQHAIVGVGFSAFVVTAAVAGLSSPGEQTAAIAVPAPIVALSTSPSSSGRAATDDRAAERAAAKTRDNREAARAQLIAAKHAAKRAKSLGLETKAIAAQQAKIKADIAAAAKRAAEEKAARERALRNRGYEPGVSQFDCFNNIIMRESMWRINATNPSSGAYGIPQALPGSKMASEGSDWRTNPATQIIWGIKYMKDRYGSPCGAWSFKRSNGWY
jgi:hypothetical protein